jgi:tape measure domain-containing protein
MASNDVIVRLRMVGAAAFSASAKAASSSVRGIGDAADRVSAKGGRFDSFLTKAGSGLAGFHAVAGRAALGMGVAGAAAVGMGIKFDAGMQQSEVAFTNLLGSGEEATAMLDDLYKLAAKTPFEFPELTKASQMMLGFGMASKDVLPTMTTIGDAVAGVGGGSEEISRLTRALGQMQAKGKVSSEELMQMAESGVPALKILQDQLGLTGTQLDKKLKAGAISADAGISALTAGMQKRYGGMAEAQSKTFSGMISSLKDNANQILGAVMMPLFEVISNKVLPAVNKVASGISKWAKSGGVTTALNALRAGFTKGAGSATAGFQGMNATLVKVGDFAKKAFGAFKTAVTDLMSALAPAMPFLRNIVLPLLTGIAKGVIVSVVASFKMLIPIIRIVATVLGWIGEKAKPLRPIIEGIGFVIGVVFAQYILGAVGALSKLGGVFKFIGGAAKIAAVPLRILGGVFRLVGSAAKGLFGILKAVGPLASRAASALLRPFKSIGSKFLEVGKAIISGIANGIKSAPGALLSALKSVLPGGKAGSLIRKAIPGLALGGVVARRGVALVGERGPEVVSLDRGARVTPLPSPSIAPIMAGGGGGNVTVPVYLDGRVITEVVAARTADRRARR